MAPKSKKAAGAGRRAGAKYKDDRVPGPAVATEEYAAVSLYHCSTVGAILFPVPPPLHTITPRHTCFFLCGSAVALPKRLLAFNDQLIRLKLFYLAHSSGRSSFLQTTNLGGEGCENTIAPPLSFSNPTISLPLHKKNFICGEEVTENRCITALIWISTWYALVSIPCNLSTVMRHHGRLAFGTLYFAHDKQPPAPPLLHLMPAKSKHTPVHKINNASADLVMDSSSPLR
jgi:hypothetical protein